MAAPSVPLIAKTWVLKVSIHCEGCKRKVQKVLQTVAGVSTINIETKLQKVTVTGNVEADTLIKKLIKSGKHAELWPEPAEKKEKKPSKPKKKEKQIDPGKSAQEGGHGSADVNKQELKGEPAQLDPAKTDQTSKSPSKPSEDGGGSAAKCSDGGPVAESKSEEKKPGACPPGNSAAAPANNGGAGNNNSGDEGKKENMEGQKREIKGESASAVPPGTARSDNHDGGPPPANLSHPRHQEHHDFPHRYQGPPPTYAVNLSYNTSHPSGSCTTSYFSPPQMQSYGYMYQQGPEIRSPPSDLESYGYMYPQGPEIRSPPLDLDSYGYMYPQGPEIRSPPLDLESHPPQPLDSFEMFSDENPNGCAIM